MNSRFLSAGISIYLTHFYFSACASEPKTNPPTDAGKPDLFSVASWNMKKLGRAKLLEIQAAKILVGADIVAIQEVVKTFGLRNDF